MLTSATLQGGQGAVPGYGCKTPPTRLVLPPWFPIWPSEKGIMVWRAPCARRRIRACRPRAARAKGSRLGSALRRLTPCPTVDWNPPMQRALPRLRPCPRSGPEGLSRARRQPRLADASRRFAVANARVDRCARLRRCAFMSFDGPIRPFGPDVRVEAHETHEPTASEPTRIFPLTNRTPYEPGHDALDVIPDGRGANDRESRATSTRGGDSGFPVRPSVCRE
jgi:hypothetical protein